MKFTQTAVLLALSFLMALATAGDIKPFNQQDFDKLTHDGKPVMLDISAPWCPTCKAQGPALSAIEADPASKDLLIFKVDFDTQKDVVKAFGARMQSTLIAFNGGAEKARSTGDTNPDSIKALAAKAYR